MLTSKTIWASKIHYLNDSREFALALNLARVELTERMRAASSKGERGRLELLRDSIYTIERTNTCVCCFSELGDSLSQWRGYGGEAGFSVGFSGKWFARAKEALALTLSPCVYDPEMQHGLVREAIDRFLGATANAEQDYWDAIQVSVAPDRPYTFVVTRSAGDDFATRLAELAPLLKDESFAAEKEWRLVAQQVSALDLEHRPGGSMLVPYYSIPIGDPDRFDSVEEIIVGPTPHPDLSLASVTSLAISTGLVNSHNSIRTRQTDIPFRSW